MAEDFLPDLDDGELWLPSDVIRAVGVCRHHHRCYDAMDDLAQKLASFDLADRRRAIPTVKHFKDSPFYPEVQFQEKRRLVSLLSPASGGYKSPISKRAIAATATATVTAGECSGNFFPVSRMAHRFHPALPLDFQLERLRHARARVLQRQRQHHDYKLNHFFPTRCAASGKKTNGTGVFLPKAYRVDPKKKTSSVKGSAELNQSWWNPVAGKQAGKYLPSSEMSLPQEWTY